MDKINFAAILWSFLFGLFIGIWIGQIEAVKKMLKQIKDGFNKKRVGEQPQEEGFKEVKQDEEVLRPAVEAVKDEVGAQAGDEKAPPGIIENP